MENDCDYYDYRDVEFYQRFYFYPRIYSDKCHFDLAWYKKIFYFIRLIPRMYFCACKKMCSATFRGKVVMDKNYFGELMAINEQEIGVVIRIITFIYFIFCFVVPFFGLCLFVTNWFIAIHSILLYIMIIGLFLDAVVFLATLAYCAIFLTVSNDIGIKRTLYACNCNLRQDIHWSIDECELKNFNEADKRKLLYPGQIQEVKLDDIHNWSGAYIYRLD